MGSTGGRQFYSGTSGMVLPVPNKTHYPTEYQSKSRLCYYGSLFNSLEVNSSFYKLPQAATVAKWAADVPNNFKFTYKLWRDITHNKELIFNPADVDRFMQVIDAAGDKKGSLLIQLPPSTNIGARVQLQKLLEAIRMADEQATWDVAVEFRNTTWYNDNIYRLLDDYRAAMVVQDMPKSITPIIDQDVDFAYVRFHGPNGGYRGSYTDAFLHEYAQYIHDYLNDGKRVYAYFNNTMGAAVQNLISINGRVAETLL